MKLFKRLSKNKLFIASVLAFGALILPTILLFPKSFINPDSENKINPLKADIANEGVTTRVELISNLGASLENFKESFVLANQIQAKNNRQVQLVNIRTNHNLNWDVTTDGGQAASWFSVHDSGGKTSVNIESLFKSWTNNGTISYSLSDIGNSLFVQQVNAIQEDDGTYDNKFIANDNNAFSYDITAQIAPPWNDDILEGADQGVSSNLKYYAFTKSNGLTSFSMLMDNSPLLINMSALTTTIVPNTGTESIHDYNPYFRSNLNSNTQYLFEYSGNASNTTPSAVNNGFYFDPAKHYAYFSGIFDAVPNSIPSTDRKFAQYLLSSTTNITNFSVKFNGSNNSLPSEYLQSIPNDFFTPDNFSFSAIQAIPSTFYGSKLKIEANDLNGTITYTLIPGIGATRESLNIGPNSFAYKFVPPKVNNSLTFVQSGWKRILDTRVENQYTLKQDDELYIQSIYAQKAIENEKLAILKKTVNDEIIFGNIPNRFDYLTDIDIRGLKFSNRSGSITFELFLTNFFSNNQIITSWKNFGQITIDGFLSINEETKIVQNEIDVNLPNISVVEWINQDNFNNIVLELINNQKAITNLPQNYQIKLNNIKRENHPPKVTVSIYLNKIFQYDQTINDYIYNEVSLDSDDWFWIGDINFVNFKEIWPTTIDIDSQELDNHQKIYSSQYTINDAKKMVLKYVKNPPANFDINNIEIVNFNQDNINGVVSFDIKLNYYYDDNLYLQTSSVNYVPKSVLINNFKKALVKTSIRPRITNIEWNKISVNDFSDDNVKNVVLTNFLGLLDDARVTMDIQRSNKNGNIIVSGTVDKYFDENGVYYDTALDNPALIFTTELYGFFPTQTTTITANRYNLALLDTLPTTIPQNVLKNHIFRLVEGKPINFSVNNILFEDINGQQVYNPDNLKGEIEVNLGLNLWYDDQGILHDDYKSFGLFTFIGLGSVQPTIIPNTGWENAGKNYIASSVANNRLELITILDNRIEGTKPPQWNASEDLLICDKNGELTTDIQYDNENGTLEVYLKLNRYYDEKGILQTTWNKPPVHIIIGGFEKLSKTTIVDEFTVPNKSDDLATDYTNHLDILKIIDQYKLQIIKNPPKNFDVYSDMKISIDNNISLNPNNLEGKIAIKYSIINYYNDDGLIEVDQSRPLEGELVLNGFKQVQPTTVNQDVKINGYQDKIASQIARNELVDIVYNNQSLFFNSIPKNGINIQSLVVSNDQLNKEGAIEIEIIYSNYYDQNGNVINQPSDPIKIKISGFRIISPTIINTSITPANKLNYYPNDINETTLTTILASNDILPLFLKNPTDDFSARDIIDVKITDRDNLTGKIVFNVGIINYYDVQGNIELTKQLTRTGLVLNNLLSLTPSSFSSEYKIPVNDAFANNLPTELTSQLLIQYLFNHIKEISNGLPNDFSISNIKNLRFEKRDNLTGEVIVKLYITNYIDQNGILQNINQKEWQLTITGFRHIAQTQIYDNIELKDVATIIPSNLDNNQIINIIMRNKNDIFSSLPDNFSQQNIVIKNFEPNNITGTAKVYISLNLYYDQNGNIQNSSVPKDAIINFSGFGHISPTIIQSRYEVKNVSNIIASEYGENNLKNVVLYNWDQIIENVPGDFNINDIRDLNIISSDNTTGSITAKLTITNFYNKINGLIEKNDLLEETITFFGFKNIGETVAISEFKLESFSNILANEYDIFNIRNIVQQYYASIFSPLPSNFSTINIDAININGVDNLKGQITLNVVLNNYFNQNGEQVYQPKTFTFILSGFKEVIPTSFVREVYLDDINNLTASTLTSDQILELIYNHYDKFIVNPGPNFSLSNISFNSFVDINNNEGKLEIVVNYSNYYTASGSLSIDEPHIQTHIISGFNQDWKVTSIVPGGYKVEGYENVLPQELSTNSNKVKEMIYEYREHLFIYLPNIDYQDLTITEITYNNLKGELYVKTFLSKYYNDNSILIDDITNKKDFDITLKGFLSVQETVQIVDSIEIENYDHVIPTSVVDLFPIRNFIWGHKDEIFSYLPNNFNINNMSLEVVRYDNLNGTILLHINLNNWYSASGEIQNTTKGFDLEIRGFSTTRPTTVNNNVDIYFPNDATPSQYYVQSITNEQLKSLIIYNKENIFNNLPLNFSIDNIANVDVIKRDNINGKIHIKISYTNYYDEKGNINYNQLKTSDTIVLSGFYPIVPTTVSNSFISVVNECGDILPSEISNDSTLINKIIINHSNEIFLGTLPSDAIVSFQKIDNYNNLDGTAQISIIVDRYYNENGILVTSELKSYKINLSGFKSIKSPSQLAGNNLSIDNQNLTININLFTAYSKLFNNLLPSQIEKDSDNFIVIIENALKSPEILHQNGVDDNSSYQNISLKATYLLGSANDYNGSIQITAVITNYWDDINGAYNSDPLVLKITLNGFKTTATNHDSFTNIIFLVLIVLAAIILALLIALLIAKLPRFFKKI